MAKGFLSSGFWEDEGVGDLRFWKPSYMVKEVSLFPIASKQTLLKCN